MMSQSVRHPFLWFAVQCAAVAVGLTLAGRFQPERVPDTASYEHFSFASLRESLAAPRTLGYPLYLRATGLLGDTQRFAPMGHFMAHVLAVCVVWRALVVWSWSVGTGMLVASSLLYSNMLLRYVGVLAPDCLAAACAIGSLGCLLLVVAHRHDTMSWVWFVLSVMVTYHLRPSYLFLTVLTPLLGCLLWWLMADRETTRGAGARLFLALGSASLVPLLAFCLLRWSVTGDFAPVAFGSNNLAGMVSSFATSQDIDTLPAAIRPLASTIFEKRQALAAASPDFPGQPTLSYMALERQFDAATWEVCVPAAREQFGAGWPEINRGLSRYSIAVIQCRPAYYVTWLVKAFVRGVYMIVSELIMNPVYLLLLFLLGVVQASLIVRLKRSSMRLERAIPDEYFWQVNTLGLIAVSFALAKTMFVILTTPPLGRFMDAAGMLLPLVLMQAFMHRIEFVRAIRHVGD